MHKDSFYGSIIKTTLVVLTVILLTRLTYGVMFGLLGLMGAMYVSRGQTGRMVACFLLIPFMMMVNKTILPMSSMAVLLARVAQLVLVIMIICQSRLNQGTVPLPFGWLYVYSFWAVVSSMDGWFPLISYLKLINFILFLIGVAFAVRQMQRTPEDLHQVRMVMLSLAILMIIGSFALRFVPSVGFSMAIARMRGGDEIALQGVMAEQGVRLFNGFTWHSQALAPISTVFATWVLIDMLLVEKRMTFLHLGIVAITPVILYWTSSRTGLVAFGSAMLLIWFYLLPTAKIPKRVKGSMQGIFVCGCILLIALAGIAETKNGTMSRWLRKTATEEATVHDERGLMEAVTESRQRLVELNLDDYRRNPLMGMGFQVMEYHKPAYERGMITLWSAPIEKGVLPLMILGETGIIGALIFVIFLLSFTFSLMARKFVATVTLFWVMIACNMSEATFFSPAGAGGILWCIAAIGGMCIDVLVLREK